MPLGASWQLATARLCACKSRTYCSYCTTFCSLRTFYIIKLSNKKCTNILFWKISYFNFIFFDNSLIWICILLTISSLLSSSAANFCCIPTLLSASCKQFSLNVKSFVYYMDCLCSNHLDDDVKNISGIYDWKENKFSVITLTLIDHIIFSAKVI